MAHLSRAKRPGERVVVGALLFSACLAATACGSRETPPKHDAAPEAPALPAGPDLSLPGTTLAAAARAIEAGDFDALAACSTADGIEHVRRDLLAWNAILTDATAGPRALSRIPSPRDERERALYAAGFKGDPSGLLFMLARSQASDEGPVAQAQIAQPVAGVVRVETDRVRPDGTRKRTVLVRRDGAWRVERIAL